MGNTAFEYERIFAVLQPLMLWRHVLAHLFRERGSSDRKLLVFEFLILL